MSSSSQEFEGVNLPPDKAAQFLFFIKLCGCYKLYPFSFMQSCVKVAMDFVSPENVNECIKLTKEFRCLPSGHRAKEDKLEVQQAYF
jgi:hypothetical protein